METRFDTTSDAPGKILWLGGYSVLERPNTSFVTTVNAKISANAKSLEGNRIVIDAPQLNARANGVIDPNTGILSMTVPEELILLKSSMEVASRYVAGLGIKLEGMQLSTKSDSAFSYKISNGKITKSGLGSSAAVTVASIGAVLKAYKIDLLHDEALHKLSQTAHSIATGKVGSGFDIAAASYGSIIYTRYSPEIIKELPSEYSNEQLVSLVKKQWDYKIEKFSLPEEFRLLFANFGEAMITTKAVGGVSDFKKKSPEAYAKIMKEINDENVNAISALKKIKKGDIGAYDEFKSAFERGRLLTKKMGELSNVGIEPDDCTNLIEESKNNGAFVAKLPGAGGKDAISALTVDKDSYENLHKFWAAKSNLKILKISLGS